MNSLCQEVKLDLDLFTTYQKTFHLMKSAYKSLSQAQAISLEATKANQVTKMLLKEDPTPTKIIAQIL